MATKKTTTPVKLTPLKTTTLRKRRVSFRAMVALERIQEIVKATSNATMATLNENLLALPHQTVLKGGKTPGIYNTVLEERADMIYNSTAKARQFLSEVLRSQKKGEFHRDELYITGMEASLISGGFCVHVTAKSITEKSKGHFETVLRPFTVTLFGQYSMEALTVRLARLAPAEATEQQTYCLVESITSNFVVM